MRDQKALARYAGLTGSPDESGAKRREQGLARAGNARVRRGMIQLAWRFLRFQKESALALWYRARTADSRLGTRKTMIVALARKLMIALWRFVTTGETLEGGVAALMGHSEEDRFARDSPLEGYGFEPSVPRRRGNVPDTRLRHRAGPEFKDIYRTIKPKAPGPLEFFGTLRNLS